MTDDEFFRARFEIHMSDPTPSRSHVIEKAISDPCIAVSGPTIRHAREVAAHGLFSIGCQSVDRRW